jgi:hypothetical protein
LLLSRNSPGSCYGFNVNVIAEAAVGKLSADVLQDTKTVNPEWISRSIDHRSRIRRDEDIVYILKEDDEGCSDIGFIL